MEKLLQKSAKLIKCDNTSHLLRYFFILDHFRAVLIDFRFWRLAEARGQWCGLEFVDASRRRASSRTIDSTLVGDVGLVSESRARRTNAQNGNAL